MRIAVVPPQFLRHLCGQTPCDWRAPLPLSLRMASGAQWRAYGTRAHPQAAEARMVQTTNRFFDEVARLMNDAAGVAQGVRREFETLFHNQAERFLRDLDVVKREEFEAAKDMARIAREENEALKARIAALEATVRAATKDAAKEAAPAKEPAADAASPNIDRPPG
jgi:BMFP domain-containing protein YqiC